MAKATHQTKVYELQSRQSGAPVCVTERVLLKGEKVAGRVVRTPLRPEITDKIGKSFGRRDGMLMRCVDNGEAFQLVEQALSIRHVSA